MSEIDWQKFEELTLEELRTIATETGILFTIGNEQIMNKEEFLLVLDEAHPDELEQSYQKIIKSRNS